MKLSFKKMQEQSKARQTDAKLTNKSSVLYDGWFDQGYRKGHFVKYGSKGSLNTKETWELICDDAMAGLTKKQKDMLNLSCKQYCKKHKLTKEEWQANVQWQKDSKQKPLTKEIDGVERKAGWLNTQKAGNLRKWRDAMVARAPKKIAKVKKPAKHANYLTEATQFRDLVGDINDPACDVNLALALIDQVIELLPKTNITKSGK